MQQGQQQGQQRQQQQRLPMAVKVAMGVCAALLVLLLLQSGGSGVFNGGLGEGDDVYGAEAAKQMQDDYFFETLQGGGKVYQKSSDVVQVDLDDDGGDKRGIRKRKELTYTWQDIEELNRKIQALAEDVIRRIEAGPPDCLPKICTEPYGFRKPERAGLDKKVGLTSIPGSGNTWIRSVIRAGTRLYTGSVYGDRGLYKQGYLGELRSSSSPTTAIVKSHYGFHYGGFVYNLGGTAEIHLIRSPFDAFLAEAQRMRSGHTGTVGKDNKLMKKTGSFAKHKLGRLRNMYDFWEKESNEEIRTRKNPVVRVHLLERFRLPVATVFYEDFQRDFTRTTAWLLAFLKVYFEEDDEWPDVYEGLVCALHESQMQEKFHRKAKSPPPAQLYRDPETDEPNELAKKICEVSQSFWNVQKWGPCDGHFQKERKDVQFHPRLHDIPENVCQGQGQNQDQGETQENEAAEDENENENENESDSETTDDNGWQGQ